jgi:hypothetical protein
MKKAIILLLMVFFTTSSFSQVGIFQHLNEIKDDSLPGELKKMSKKEGYIYSVNDESMSTIFGYALTNHLYCYMTIAKPTSSISLQSWVQNLNQKWVIVNENKWLFYREDGNILESELSYDDNQPMFIFSIKKMSKK